MIFNKLQFCKNKKYLVSSCPYFAKQISPSPQHPLLGLTLLHLLLPLHTVDLAADTREFGCFSKLALDNARRRISGIKTDCRKVFGDSYSCLSVRVLSGPGRPSQQRPRYREHSVLTIQPFETLATPEMFIYRLRNRLAAAR